MKSTQVNRETGQVVCPKCGGSQFNVQRTAKAKLALVPTVGVGALAAPKRLKCMGCGAFLKRGGDALPQPKVEKSHVSGRTITFGSAAPAASPPAGWYPEGNRRRYWDGGRWTEHYA